MNLKIYSTHSFLLLLILALTCVFYAPTFSNDFTNWDDQIQVINNPDIKNLSIQNVKSIFSSFYVGMYQPITTLCFAIEYHFFELSAKAFHTVSLVFHLINCTLVYWLVVMVLKRKDLALIVVSLFAVHPMFVEAVAWVSARSTLIYTTFYLTAIITYLYYIKTLKHLYFRLTLGIFILALLSKVMAITLPVLLLLIDVYYKRKLISKTIFFEKIPFFSLSITFGIVAIFGRQIEGHFTEGFSFLDKIFVMSYQILWYVFKFFNPTDLHAFYANPNTENGYLPLLYYCAPFIILCFGFLGFKLKRFRYPLFFLVLFFLIHIALVLKIIQVGNQLTTDRYTYIPYIGLLVFISLIFRNLTERKPSSKPYLGALVTVVFLGFGFLTYKQVKVWKNSRSLWSHVIANDDTVSIAHTNLGVTYIGEDDFKAENYFKKAIEVDEMNVIPYNNIGYININKNPKKAEHYLFKAMEVDPEYLYIYTNLAQLYMYKNKEKALKYIKMAEVLKPENHYVKLRIKTWNSIWNSNENQ